MLRAELEDSNIPHRTMIHDRILQSWDDHLDLLEDEMAVCACMPL